MACYHPIPAYQRQAGAKLILNPPHGTATLHVPCGKCIGCKAARAQQWAYRIMHETRAHDWNCFVTLTYDDEKLPRDLQLRPDHVQRFLKKLRRAAERGTVKTGKKIRFFACGEYGETTFRPHYHILLFDCEFPDAIVAGKDLKQSDVLDKIWGHGACRFGDVTPGSALYCASYAVKKQHYPVCDADGVITQKPFIRMSLKPGIGATWLDGFREDLREGYLVVDRRSVGIPRAYTERLKRIDPALADMALAKASERARKLPRRTPEQLAVSEQIHWARERNKTGVL